MKLLFGEENLIKHNEIFYVLDSHTKMKHMKNMQILYRGMLSQKDECNPHQTQADGVACKIEDSTLCGNQREGGKETANSFSCALSTWG